MGDTGLWFVPTGEILPAKKWSASAYRVNFDYQQGFTDVSNWPVTFGFGLGDRAEVFGAWTRRPPHRPRRRVRSSVRPTRRRADLSTTTRSCAGLVGQSARRLSGSAARSTCCPSGGSSRWRLAVRGMVKIPTAKDDDEGVGHRQARLRLRRHRQQGNQPARRALGLRRLHRPRRSRRRRSLERLPLGLRRRLPDAQAACASPRNCTARSSSTTWSTAAPGRSRRRGRLAAAARVRRGLADATSRSA